MTARDAIAVLREEFRAFVDVGHVNAALAAIEAELDARERRDPEVKEALTDLYQYATRRRLGGSDAPWIKKVLRLVECLEHPGGADAGE